MGKKILTHRELQVYVKAFETAMTIFEATKTFPQEERYSITDQIRRSSRSVCANIAEAWRKRRYEKAFINKLSDAESEAGETQVWIEFASRCGYLSAVAAERLDQQCDEVLRMLSSMITHPEQWVIEKDDRSLREAQEDYLDL